MNKYILVGNPNTGKTTFFNAITHKNNHVGNWHGVTVDISIGEFNYSGTKSVIYDVPGIYSLSGYSSEEKTALNFLKEHRDYNIICLVDNNNLRRNLLLAISLKDAGYNVVISCNKTSKKEIDNKALEKLLKIKVVCIDARKTKESKKVLDAFTKLSSTNNKISCNFNENYIQNTYQKIDGILKEIKYNPCDYGYSKLDKIIYNKFWSPILFVAVMLVVFFITFGVIGQSLSLVFSNLFSIVYDLINNFLIRLNISAWAHSLLINGVLSGVGIVVGFLPQVVLLHLCLNFLENVGYLSRVAFMFDGMLKKIGLSGKSVFTILMGYGCTATAMTTTKAIFDKKEQKRVALLLPFASCNAKLPIFLLISSVFFAKFKVLFVFLLYILSILIGILVSFIHSRVSKSINNVFVMEIPPLRVQNIKSVFKNAINSSVEFIKRIGSTIVLCSIVVWVISNINFKFEYVTDEKNSILYSIGNIIAPIFKPLGLNNPGIVISLIIGLVAKEMVVSTLAIANGISQGLPVLVKSLSMTSSVVHFSIASSLSFLVFVLLYSPCISALSVTSKQMGKKFTIFMFIFQLVLAYLCAAITYFLATLIETGKFIEFFIILIVLAITIVLVVKYIKNMGNNCTGCNKKCNGKNNLSKRGYACSIFKK